MNNKINFVEFMNQTKSINRWFILRVAIIGAFCGALLAITYLMVLAAN